MFDFKCPGCNASHQLPDRVIGRKFRCPTCNAKVKHHPDGRVEIRERASSPGPQGPVESAVDDELPEISLPAENLLPHRVSLLPAATPSRFSPDSLSGTVVGNYKLIGHIGSGSSGHVYLAEHQTLKRKMAVKLLAPALAPSPDRVARLAQEAVALAKVDHPNVVHVYDFWIEMGNPYIAMQFVDGPSLDQAIKSDGPFSTDKLVKLAHDLLQGLEVIHQAGLLHRDIKPSNVLLTKEGEARLVDFGLAWETPQVSALPSNIFSGTAEYAAPELAVGQPPDARTDLYALGGTLYKAATGRTPFSGSTVAEKLKKQLYEPLTHPRSLNTQVSSTFETFLLKLLNKERDARPATAKEALNHLGPVGGASIQPKNTRRILAVRTTSTSVVPVLIVSLVLAGALGLIAYLSTHPKIDSQSKDREKKPAVSKIPSTETPPPSPPKQPPPVIDPTEKPDLDYLEQVLAAGSPPAAIDACSEFLRRHPQSIHCESVLIKKMELQQELERQTRKAAPDPVIARPSTPPKRDPVPPKEPQKPIVTRLKRSTTGVPCRLMPVPVREGLLWLARHQTDAGYWDMQLYPQLCVGGMNCGFNQESGSPDYHIGVNSLAILAFLGAGIGMNSRDEIEGTNLGDAVREGIRYIVRIQGADGRIGNNLGPKQTYAQAFAVNALAEAVRSLSAESGISDEEAKRIRRALELATEYLLISQNPGVGWRYGVRPGDNDSSVTAAALLGLHAARRAGVRVPVAAFDGGLDWFTQVTDPRELRVGYNARGTGKVYVPGKNEQFHDHPTLTAAAGVCQTLLSKDNKPLPKISVQLVAKDLPRSEAYSIDFYYWYYGIRFAVLALDGKDLEAWKSVVVKILTAAQSAESMTCRRGAWVSNDRWSAEGGRIYAIALNTITLEYAMLPRTFEFGPSRQPDVVSNAQPAWIFKLKAGGKVQALSFEEQPESYEVKVAGGAIRILKDDVEQILKAEGKSK